VPDSGQVHSHATILVVDDHPDARKLLTLLLKPEGHHILQAADGPEALRLADATPDLSLIVLDVMMPGMDGLEVCRQLRAVRRDRYVPIILVTALDDEEYLCAGLGAGADDYITKPINPAQILARVRTALRLKAALDELIESRELAAIGALQVTLAHEINNPLTIAQGNIEMLLNAGGSDPATSRRLRAAFEACTRIRALVQQLVEMKKVATTTYVGTTRMLHLGRNTHPPDTEDP